MKYSNLMVSPLIMAITALWIAPAEAQSSEDAEAAIRRAAQEFVEAFDRGDAKAVADHFATDGVYVNEDGQRFEGRDAIEQEYKTLFENTSDVKIRIEIDSVRLVGATTAVEEGRSALTPQPPGANRVMSVYTAVHTLQDGKWLMAHVRDNRVELPLDVGQLEDLNWLVGTWTAVNEKARVEIKGRWIEENHYLARTHSVTDSDKVTLTGLEIIGVDPETERITSWSFNSDGGRAVGIWAPHDQGWIVESVGATGDGTATLAINNLSQTDNDTLVWNSTDRFIGDVPLPDIQNVTLTRQ